MHRKVSDEQTLTIKRPLNLRRFKPDEVLWWTFFGAALGVVVGTAVAHAMGML